MTAERAQIAKDERPQRVRVGLASQILLRADSACHGSLYIRPTVLKTFARVAPLGVQARLKRRPSIDAY